MHDAQLLYAQNFALETAHVLSEVVDDQLREAAWSSTARLRLLAQPHSTLAALTRREHYLRGHMAGLASAYAPRLARRLTHILGEPEETPAEAFVAALLLLRCERGRYEGQVFAAWRDATCPAMRRQIGLALCHGELRDPALQAQLTQLLASDDAALCRAAADVVGRLRLPMNARVHRAVLALGPSRGVDTMVLRLMSQRAWPVEPDRVARALAQGDDDVELACAAEAVLAVHAPDVLGAIAHRALAQAGDVSTLGLEALVACAVPHTKPALTALAVCLTPHAHPDTATRALAAIGLSGAAEAAHMAMEALAQASDDAVADAAIEAFTAITGVTEGDGLAGAPESGWAVGPRAVALRAAWGHGSPSPTLFGQVPGAHGLLQAAPGMQVGRWQSFSRFLQMRSAGQVDLPTWRLWEQTAHEIRRHADIIDAAWSTQGLAPTALGQALRWMRPPGRP